MSVYRTIGPLVYEMSLVINVIYQLILFYLLLKIPRNISETCKSCKQILQLSRKIFPVFLTKGGLITIYCSHEYNQRTNGPVNAHLISGPTVSTKKQQILTSIKGRNSVGNLRNTIIYNTNIDLVNDDVYTKIWSYSVNSFSRY